MTDGMGVVWKQIRPVKDRMEQRRTVPRTLTEFVFVASSVDQRKMLV